jgi:hypothetical protein
MQNWRRLHSNYSMVFASQPIPDHWTPKSDTTHSLPPGPMATRFRYSVEPKGRRTHYVR